VSDQERSKAVATTQIDNESTVVTEWRFPPGAETGWHRHNYDYVVVPMTSGSLLLETTTGSNEASLTQGISYFRSSGVEHNVVNNNPHEFVFVEIEFK
jgi:quercetin dioxygenase-like cupin family protein